MCVFYILLLCSSQSQSYNAIVKYTTSTTGARWCHQASPFHSLWAVGSGKLGLSSIKSTILFSFIHLHHRLGVGPIMSAGRKIHPSRGCSDASNTPPPGGCSKKIFCSLRSQKNLPPQQFPTPPSTEFLYNSLISIAARVTLIYFHWLIV